MRCRRAWSSRRRAIGRASPAIVVVWRARNPIDQHSVRAIGRRRQDLRAGKDGAIVGGDGRARLADGGGGAGRTRPCGVARPSRDGGRGGRRGHGARRAQARRGSLPPGACTDSMASRWRRSRASTTRRSTDRASVERELAKGVCYCCKTALALGGNGAVYAAWRHVYTGNIRDIAFIASTDGGRTFAEPMRVSEDRWELAGCPDDGPSMAVDAAARFISCGRR